MNDRIDYSSVVPLSEMKGDSPHDTELLRSMADEAKIFVQGFDWCKSIQDSFFGFGVGGVVAVFFFHIVPASKEVGDCLWVVVGDVPPAYLVTDEASGPVEALRVYVPEMSKWVAAMIRAFRRRDPRERRADPVEGRAPRRPTQVS